MDTKQHALAAEIRAEVAAQRITAKDMQRAVGVSSSAWSNWFITCTRDVPMGVVVDVAATLGMTGSELLRRAESRAETMEPVDELEAGLSRSGRRALEAARAAHREAGGGGVDPSGRTRADEDDGAIGRTATG